MWIQKRVDVEKRRGYIIRGGYASTVDIIEEILNVRCSALTSYSVADRYNTGLDMVEVDTVRGG